MYGDKLSVARAADQSQWYFDAVTQPTPAALIRDLRHLIASAISDAKAYEVPSLCGRLGLADGETDEAFGSKYRYAQKRLAAVAGADLVGVARKLLEEVDHHRLSEAVAKYEEVGGPEISGLTRKRIMAVFDDRPLASEMSDVELLRKLWPLSEMRRADDDSDTRTLEEAIFQHTVRNYDWDNRDLLRAVGFETLSKAQLFRFLGAVVDPLAQSPEGQAQLVTAINDHLKHDGYRLIEVGRISGSPRYEVRATMSGAPSDDSISATLASFSPDDVHARWTAALDRRSSDPSGAITLARTLLEDVCKWILAEAGDDTVQDKDDLPVLYKKLAKVLKLAPDDHAEQIFKEILGNCQHVVVSLGALRNKLGDAHSPGPKRARPLARHAELAVNLSGTMATFLISTWRARQMELP
jgi:hypothetical protein